MAELSVVRGIEIQGRGRGCRRSGEEKYKEEEEVKRHQWGNRAWDYTCESAIGRKEKEGEVIGFINGDGTWK